MLQALLQALLQAFTAQKQGLGDCAQHGARGPARRFSAPPGAPEAAPSDEAEAAATALACPGEADVASLAGEAGGDMPEPPATKAG